MLNRFFLILMGLGFTFLSAQEQAPKNWFNLDPKQDGFPGLSTESLYNRLKSMTGKKGETVVVAVIDSGVDYEHEDLKPVMWTNPGEIAGDGIDNDKNGYIDDIHGWNFIGNAKGENVYRDNLEITRLYASYKKEFEKANPESLSSKDKKRYAEYKEMEEKVLGERKNLSETWPTYKALKESVAKVTKQVGKETGVTIDDLDKVQPGPDQMLARLVQILKAQMGQGATFEGFLDQLNQAYDYFDERLNYNYNPDFDPRILVGDNYADVTEKYYGNNDVRGPDANHGTHVAGIIGAVRGNNLGIDGISDNVRIMSVRTVPDGDERDKDVANAIRYAVDNGAKIINMSFGKGYSPYKKAVDEAIRYAAKKDVLLVHAAGNDGSENTGKNNFPNDEFSKRGFFGSKFAPNWLEVGALNWQGNEKLAADFSNYSGNRVDLFSPGVDIYSTVVGSKYDSYPGTSMAAPMVAGAAALLCSYFPDLNVVQIKNILMESTIKQSQMVVKPGTDDEKVPFSSLSVSGGILNVEKAFEKALSTPGKKTNAKRYITLKDLPVKTVVIP